MALAGLHVIELAEGIAGPYAAKLLADLGAEVIKIELPPDGDVARQYGPFPDHRPHPEQSGAFLYLNTNKQSFLLDLEAPEGQHLLRTLVAHADLLIEDRPPGWLAARQLDYATLQQRHPALVMVSLTRFGQEGPQAHFHGTPLTTAHAGGEAFTLPGRLSLDLFPEREPVQPGGMVSEYDSGLGAAVAALGALLSGHGQHIDVSQQEVLMNLNRPVMTHYFAQGDVVDRQRGYAYGGTIPCKDGYVLLRPIEDNHWQALARAMGRPELIEDARFRTRQARTEHGAVLNSLIIEWAMQQDKVELYERIASTGCPVGYFATAADVVHSPQLAAREFFIPSPHLDLSQVRLPSAPYRLSRTPWTLRRPAPRLGEHTRTILASLQRLAQ